MSKIEWTEQTWNPFAGCLPVSSGCKNCYAQRQAFRVSKLQPGSHYEGLTDKVKGKSVWNGKVGKAPDAVWHKPLNRKKPTRYFVNSMGDVFHPEVPDAWIDRLFAIMALAPQHTFQILTKHPERMRSYLTRPAGEGLQDIHNHIAWEVTGRVMNLWAPQWKGQPVDGPHRSLAIQAAVIWPLTNVHLGVSVEDNSQRERIKVMQDVPAAIRFISYEPALGPLDLTDLPGGWNVDGPGIDWVICGGESGPNARPMHPDWARDIREQCAGAGVPFFFKQWGEWVSYIDRENDDPDWQQNYSQSPTFRNLNFAGGNDFHGARVHHMQRVGKKAAGRLLDGREHNELPIGGAS